MPPVTESEVKELRDLITDFREEVRIGMVSIRADIKAVDQKIATLDQRVTSLDDRLKTQDGKIWTLVTILLGGAVTLLIKILGFPNS
jgi:hypothetical protein